MLFPIVGDEPLVLLVGQVVDPFLSTRDAERGVPLTGQSYFVDRERGVEWDLNLEPGLHILEEELCAGRARIKRKDRVGFCVPGLSKLYGEVELVRPLGQFLPDDLAL